MTHFGVATQSLGTVNYSISNSLFFYIVTITILLLTYLNALFQQSQCWTFLTLCRKWWKNTKPQRWCLRKTGEPRPQDVQYKKQMCLNQLNVKYLQSLVSQRRQSDVYVFVSIWLNWNLDATAPAWACKYYQWVRRMRHLMATERTIDTLLS